MRRRSVLSLLAVVVLVPIGCSSGSSSRPRRRAAKSSSSRPSTARSGSSRPGGKSRLKGPQGFGNIMVPEWIKDLDSGSPEKRVRAARELSSMGSGAKAALPALERAAQDKNPQVSAAAREAINAIRR